MLSPSRMLSLGLPLMMAYLTYTTIQDGARAVSQFAQPATSVIHKSRDGGALDEVSKRNPFDPDVSDKITEILSGPAAAMLGEQAVSGVVVDPTEEEEGMKLIGTAIMGKWRMAIVDGRRLREGDRYKGMTLSVVAVDRVIFTDSLGRNVLVPLDVATSDEIVLAEENAKADAKGSAIQDQPPLQRGLSALTGGSQGDILKMLGIPES